MGLVFDILITKLLRLRIDLEKFNFYNLNRRGNIFNDYAADLSSLAKCLSAAVMYLSIKKLCLEKPRSANDTNFTVLKFAREIWLLTNVMVSVCGQIKTFLWPLEKLIWKLYQDKVISAIQF